MTNRPGNGDPERRHPTAERTDIQPRPSASHVTPTWAETERRRSADRIRHEAARAEALLRSAARFNAQLNLDHVLDLLVEEVVRALDVAVVSIYLYDEHSKTFSAARVHGLPPEFAAQSGPFESRQALDVVRRALRDGLVVLDLQAVEGLRDPELVRRFGLRSLVCAGLVHDDEVIGAITGMTLHRVREFGADERALLRGLADQAAQAITNARLHEQLQRHSAELETLHDMTSALSLDQSFDRVLDKIMQCAGRLLHAQNSAIFLMDERRRSLTLSVGKHFPEPDGTQVALGEGLAGQVALSGKPLIVDDYHTWAGRAPAYSGEPLASVVGVPMLFRGQLVGVLVNVEFKPSTRKFTSADAHLLSMFASQAASVVHNAQVLEQSERRSRQLEALRAIDLAIIGSMDVRLALDVVLEQAVRQLRVDAVDVLLLNRETNTLEFAAGRGFRSRAVERTRVRIGDGVAGKVVLERRPVHESDLTTAGEFARGPLIAGEAFVSYVGVPLIVKGKVLGVLDIFQRSTLEPDSEWLDFLDALGGQAAIAIDNSLMYQRERRAHEDLLIAYDATIEGWSRALDLRDRETEGHTVRVTEVTLRLARTLGVPDDELLTIRRGALLHDIGKVGIPDSILHKPGPLDEDEWRVMRLHPQMARDLLSPVMFLREALAIPYCHHEQWDGSGYPQRLKGISIPLPARIFAVVDVWDALRSDRPYRKAWPEEQVLSHIRALTGKHFDPQIAEAFLHMLDLE